jgi:hypothetical protein
MSRFVVIPVFALLLGSLPALSFAAPANPVQGWTCYSSSKENFSVERYQPLTVSAGSSGTVLTYNAGRSGSLPKASVQPLADGVEWCVRAEADRLVADGRGDCIAAWTCPQIGDWRIDVKVRNEGQAVKGGDGGKLIVTYLRAQDKLDNTTIFKVGIPHSKDGRTISQEEILKLNSGDRLLFRFNAGIDGFADQFRAKFGLRRSNTPGREIKVRGLEAFLPEPPPKGKAVPGAKLTSGLFWLGTSGNWANSQYARESIDLIRRYIPELAVVMITSFPEHYNQPAFYRELGIPTIPQTHGAGYEPYFKHKQAFEIDWLGRVLDKPGMCPLSGKTHAFAIPHPAWKTAFGKMTQTSIRSGYSGSGFCDLVWMWGAGRGRTGFNPHTIEAFRQDLLKTDEGVVVQLPGQEAKTFYLSDYADYYIGGLPRAQDLGFSSWADYSPLTQAQVKKNPSRDVSPHYLLMDLLCHYEWVKAADFLGQTAQREGGFFQCMPNPEDMANGSDFFFGSALPSVRAMSEEFFNSPSFLDGAYYRFPYLASPRQGQNQAGLVMETGHGGNGWPYYANELSYAVAYELTLAAQADHMEGDFWPSAQSDLPKAVNNEQNARRYQQLLAYGLGFRHAQLDGAKRIRPEFVSITSRRLFRPWGQAYHPWDWHLDNEGSPEKVLAEAGFNFEGIGEDGLERLSETTPVVLYSPNIPTQKGLETLLTKLRNGTVREAIMIAPNLENVVMRDFRTKSLTEVSPNFKVKIARPSWRRGQIRTATPVPGSGRQSFLLDGKRWTVEGWQPELTIGKQPLVVSKRIGKGRLKIMLFDPTKNTNRAIAEQVFGDLLAKHDIRPHWTSPSSKTMARLYRKGDLQIVGVQNQAARDWKPISKIKGKEHCLPYCIKGQTKLSMRCDPRKAYQWLAMPSGKRGTATADADGWLKLSLNKTSHEIFFVLPASPGNETRLDEIAIRRQILTKALTLNGLINHN